MSIVDLNTVVKLCSAGSYGVQIKKKGLFSGLRRNDKKKSSSVLHKAKCLILGFKKVLEAVVRQHDKGQSMLRTSLRDPFLSTGENTLQDLI